MSEQKFCEACEMPYDWPGVMADGEEYCCAGCARGEACTCPQYRHIATPEPVLTGAGAGPMGDPIGAPAQGQVGTVAAAT
jgi:hypothetical protein